MTNDSCNATMINYLYLLAVYSVPSALPLSKKRQVFGWSNACSNCTL